MKQALGLAILALLTLSGCGAGPSNGGTGNNGSGAGINSVNHVIILMQENRSFDTYFAKLNEYRAAHGLGAADVDVMNLATTSLETWDGSPNVTPFHMYSMCTANLSPSWVEAHVDLDVHHYPNPQQPYPMDGFVYTAGGFCAHNGCADTAGARALGYYDDSDIPFYYWAATEFATSDRWFSPGLFRTQPSRMYLLAATSQGHVYEPQQQLTAKTIFQALDEAGITWKVYLSHPPDSQNPLGQTYMQYFAWSFQHTANFVPLSQYYTDAAAGTLPQVALIESGYDSDNQTGAPTDEHPQNDVQVGANFARDITTTLMNSPSWKDSVLFITYDEGGGLYDHVAPFSVPSPDGIPPQDLQPGDPVDDFTTSGFRIPLLVISPFTKKGYVSHTNSDTTGMLKFIETRFGISPLTKRDAAMPDMTEFFDFANSPNLNPGPVPNQPVVNSDPTVQRCYQDHLP